MSAKALDVLNKRFGSVIVLERSGSDKGGALWLCRCDCGIQFLSHGHTLARGTKKSCGCLARKHAAQMGAANKRHGMTGKTEYNIWLSMRARCNNTKNINYRLYGAKGIKVCDRWQESFDSFYADMGPRPSSRHSVDRIDSLKGYSPENCRWATLEEQAKNKSVTHKIEWNGHFYSLSELIEKLGIPESTVYHRIKAGASIHQALTMKRFQKIKNKQALTFQAA